MVLQIAYDVAIFERSGEIPSVPYPIAELCKPIVGRIKKCKVFDEMLKKKAELKKKKEKELWEMGENFWKKENPEHPGVRVLLQCLT
ncbi:hypothetical protein CCACVL1_07494 [Corchorus capsularis]|uniref:Uncharacterized protein n=1 Tax=Corchorus capsularis TaxID=210143 RepID=A0A1R3J5M6_COCAP|nr:hypothetical protein CCACVL1_07494 [Corchorus capsularis]